MTPPLLAACALAWGVALAFGAFAGPRAAPADPVVVVATTTQAADFARRVGEGRVEVRGLLEAQADPHGHEASPGDVSAIAGARLVVRSGGEVDHWLDDVLDAAGADAEVLDLSRSVRRLGEDPHWWQDPRNARRAVLAIGRALAVADPAGAGAHRRSAARYAARIAATDRTIAACWAAVPRARRRLVTTHDSYGYYARRYGLTVVGSVIPSLSSRGQPSAQALSRLVRTVRTERIRAIFTERALNARVERAVAREAGASVGRPLWGDTLGPAGSPGATYLGALRADSRTLLDGLAGRRVECALP